MGIIPTHFVHIYTGGGGGGGCLEKTQDFQESLAFFFDRSVKIRKWDPKNTNGARAHGRNTIPDVRFRQYPISE